MHSATIEDWVKDNVCRACFSLAQQAPCRPVWPTFAVPSPTTALNEHLACVYVRSTSMTWRFLVRLDLHLNSKSLLPPRGWNWQTTFCHFHFLQTLLSGTTGEQPARAGGVHCRWSTSRLCSRRDKNTHLLQTHLQNISWDARYSSVAVVKKVALLAVKNRTRIPKQCQMTGIFMEKRRRLFWHRPPPLNLGGAGT